MKFVERFKHKLFLYLLKSPVGATIRNAVRTHETTIAQLDFLLSQAPMLDAATDRLVFMATKNSHLYIYLNPVTFDKLKKDISNLPRGAKLVLTPWMPKDRVIYSPNKIPTGTQS